MLEKQVLTHVTFFTALQLMNVPVLADQQEVDTNCSGHT